MDIPHNIGSEFLSNEMIEKQLESISELSDKNYQLFRHIEIALDEIESILNEYRMTEIAFAFNGGKDSVVLLHLLVLGLHRYYKKTKPNSDGIVNTHAKPEDESSQPRNTFGLFDEPNPVSNSPSKLSIGLHGMAVFYLCSSKHEEFPSVIQMIKNEISHKYRLHVRRMYCDWIKPGLEAIQESLHLKAMFLGTRAMDSKRHKTHRAMADPDWPQFMRLQPLLDWSHGDVWSFIKHFEVPFSELYVQGYTSIGQVNNTKPNPHLLRANGTYAPAWELADGDLERAGRV